jgi:hypothetical protein
MYIINNSTFIILIINYKINKNLNMLNKNNFYKVKLNKNLYHRIIILLVE